MVSAPVRRRQAELAHRRGLSIRRACALMNVPRSTWGYEARMPAKDQPVIEAMRRLSAQFPRFGYRRIHVYLDREGHKMGWDRAHRLWSQAGLQVPRKRPRRRIASNRPRPLPAAGPNQVWAYDFVFDVNAAPLFPSLAEVIFPTLLSWVLNPWRRRRPPFWVVLAGAGRMARPWYRCGRGGRAGARGRGRHVRAAGTSCLRWG